MNTILPAFGIFSAVLIIFAISLLPLIFYLLTLQNTLKQVSIENQMMPPGQVWLCIIPFFGWIWNFIVVDKLSTSLQREFTKRGIAVNEERPAYQIGLIYAILTVCAVIPFLGWFASLGGFICWIIYWIKVADYKSLLQRNTPAQ